MKEHDETWDACPPGELRRMVGRVKDSRRRTVVHRLTSVLAVLSVVSAGAWLGSQVFDFRSGEPAPQYGDLTCAQVQEMLVDYGRGVMSARLEEQIAAHLRQCSHCRAVYEGGRLPPRDDSLGAGVDAGRTVSVALYQPR